MKALFLTVLLTFVSLVATVASFGREGRVLRALNPLPFPDDTFVIEISREGSIVKFVAQPWVTPPVGFESNDVLFTFDRTDPAVRKAQIRIFAVAPRASFEDIEKEVALLSKIGFRPTSFIHLVGFCNSRIARDTLPPASIVFTSDRPMLKWGVEIVIKEAFFSARKDVVGYMHVDMLYSESIGSIPENVPKFLLLEAPAELGGQFAGK